MQRLRLPHDSIQTSPIRWTGFGAPPSVSREVMGSWYTSHAAEAGLGTFVKASSKPSKKRRNRGGTCKSAAGYRGEKSLDYYLSFLPENECLIFNDLRLPHKNYFFQIDILVLSTRFHLIVVHKLVKFVHKSHKLMHNNITFLKREIHHIEQPA
ncbi:nuclease-related domain-containing protein [Alteribacillus sp. JSM 102045]|uniref:nuclease-related domain-containing protein n=1 Tax=Alteribacillus sp. JSM 102045 TaxID=1562101 RepID=UPI0035BF8BE7